MSSRPARAERSLQAGLVVAFVLAALAVYGIAQLFPAAKPIPVPPPVGVRVLFVQQSLVGTLTNGKLTARVPRTQWFSDRPVRIAGSQPTQAFVDSWRARNVDKKPPIAALVVDGPDADAVAALELRDPQFNAATGALAFSTRPVVADPYGLKARGVVPVAFTTATLFIDDVSLTWFPPAAAPPGP